MPPKSKRKLSLEKNCERAREAKRKRNSGEGTSSGSQVSELQIGDDSVQLRLAQFFLGESVQVCARLYARTCLYPIT